MIVRCLAPLLVLAGLLTDGDPFAVPAPAPPGFDRDAVRTEVRQYLEALIGLDTTNAPEPAADASSPNGNEIVVAGWLQGVLDAAYGDDFESDSQYYKVHGDVVFLREDKFWREQGMETHLFTFGTARAAFVARVRAGRLSERPVMLVSHMDVVPADATRWSSPPFDPTIQDGYVHGRGALDAKGPLAAQLAAFLAVARGRDRLERDVLLVATSGGEGLPARGGTFGIGIGELLAREYHNKWLGDPEYALVSDGGAVRIVDGTIRSVVMQSSEPVRERLLLKVSIPREVEAAEAGGQAAAALERALARLPSWRGPPSRGEAARDVASGLAVQEGDPSMRAALQRLAEPDTDADAVEAALDTLEHRPDLRTALRSTVGRGTDAGMRQLVNPRLREAPLLLMRMPWDDVHTLVEDLDRYLGEEYVSVSLEGEPAPTPATAPDDSALMLAITEVLAEMAPGTIVDTTLGAETSEAGVLRAAGISAYGLVPIPLTDADRARRHGVDERAPVDGLLWAAEWYYRVLTSPRR